MPIYFFILFINNRVLSGSQILSIISPKQFNSHSYLMKLFLTAPITLTQKNIHVLGIKNPPIECD